MTVARAMMEHKDPVKTGSSDLDRVINEWLEWNRVNFLLFY